VILPPSEHPLSGTVRSRGIFRQGWAGPRRAIGFVNANHIDPDPAVETFALAPESSDGRLAQGESSRLNAPVVRAVLTTIRLQFIFRPGVRVPGEASGAPPHMSPRAIVRSRVSTSGRRSRVVNSSR
jgi:hypothetical protein